MYHLHDDKRVAQSISQIWTALEELIETMQYNDISVTLLAKSADISKATFYRSFDYIDDVLELQTDRCVADMIEYIWKYRSDIGRDLSGEFVFFQAFYRYWMSHSSIIEQLIKTKNEYILQKAFENTLKKNISYFDRYVKIDKETQGYFFAIRAASLSACLLCWIKDGKQIHPDEMPAIMARIMRTAEPITTKENT